MFSCVKSGSPTWRTPVHAQKWNLGISRVATMGIEHGTLHEKTSKRFTLVLYSPKSCLCLCLATVLMGPMNETPQQRVAVEICLNLNPKSIWQAFHSWLLWHLGKWWVHPWVCDTLPALKELTVSQERQTQTVSSNAVTATLEEEGKQRTVGHWEGSEQICFHWKKTQAGKDFLLTF